MFRCDGCKEFTRPNEKMHKLIVDKRPKTYHNKVKKDETKKDSVTKGWEIAREKDLCGSCYALATLQ